ncbi:hypothetical protein KI387_016843, partial [Taxus chinensis]
VRHDIGISELRALVGGDGLVQSMFERYVELQGRYADAMAEVFFTHFVKLWQLNLSKGGGVTILLFARCAIAKIHAGMIQVHTPNLSPTFRL